MIALTDQQQAVVDSNANQIVVQAYAGSGKTQTLLEYARRRPQKRFLYLVFNRAMAQSAMRRFPRQVTVTTAHGLAFRAIGNQYKHKLGEWNAPDIASYIAENYQGRIGKQAFSDLNPEVQISLAHLVIHAMTTYAKGQVSDLGSIHDPGLVGIATNFCSRATVRELGEWLWGRVCDPAESRLPITHDAYLKEFIAHHQHVIDRYDVVMLDEAQDTNPVIWDLVEKIPAQTKMMVGDRYQNIYDFRGTINVLDRCPEAEQHYLTKTFRFGKKVAWLANQLLTVFFRETHLIQSDVPEGRELPDDIPCYIHRTNAGILATVIEHPRHRMRLYGGVDGYRLGDILDTYSLKRNRFDRIQNPFLRIFSSFDELKDYAQQYDDREWQSRVNLVERYQGLIPRAVKRCREMEKEGMPEIWLSTVHKTKGLEFPKIAMADDFPTLMAKAHGKPKQVGETSDGETIPAEEVRLWYVAVTRTLSGIFTNRQLDDFLLFSYHR
ncbi:MAG: UvrD-helicase domain-containing protein [Chloracidobacterium sp.]